MNNYPKVNYIGNKQKVVNWIYDVLPIKKGTVLDLFSGGNSVSYFLKKKNFKVLSNDFLYSNYVLAKAIIENNKTILKKEDFDSIKINEQEIDNKYNELSFLVDNLYFDYEVRELAELVLISEKLTGYKKYIFLSLLRRAMIRKIPYSRMNIKWEEIIKFRDEEYSYQKYKRRRAYHNQSFRFHILDNLDDYNNAVFSNNENNKAYHCDSLKLLKNIRTQIDIIYLDPPYPGTMNNYENFYGIYDEIFNECINDYIDLTSRHTFMDNFKLIIKTAVKKTKFLVISLNNRVSIDISDLKTFLSRYGILKCYEMKHTYKVTGKENKNLTSELLLVLEVKKNRCINFKASVFLYKFMLVTYYMLFLNTLSLWYFIYLCL